MSMQELEQSSDRDGAATPASPVSGLAAPARWRKPPDPMLLERLAETGFLATEFGLHEYAERIFLCLCRLRQGKPSPLIALAMVQARRGLMPQAIADLRAVIEQYPESELARAVLGTMLAHIGDPEGLQVLQDVIARGVDTAAVEVATSGIEQAQTQATATPATQGYADAIEFFRHYNIRA